MDGWFERSPFIGFVPWIIYWVVADGPSTWMFGAMCAVIATLILGVSAGYAGVRLLDIVTVVFFTAVTIAGLVLGHQDGDWMDTYATTLSSGVLAVMALVSLAFEPFTAQYAPPSAPREPREQIAFRRTNQVLTLMWALVFALIAALGYLAATSPTTVHLTKAVIPVVVLVGAVGMTLAYPRHARDKALREAS
ncbi:hypothetical protein [Mycobacterium sp. SMC-4]|uniref:hypothetical protein n=1 Tax=Mycobacterium sp. SMC-4 TaxID=2857059 RepID=UPI0021B26553|nr:hypothetical protein [Mycobacterium sp. SMC-4]UXA16129.1 hypothetical protein KXD98_14855 [Mycobacterium sp. SMC-4]